MISLLIILVHLLAKELDAPLRQGEEKVERGVMDKALLSYSIWVLTCRTQVEDLP